MIRPLYDRVLIRRIPPKEHEGLIIVPDSVDRPSFEGIVEGVSTTGFDAEGKPYTPTVKIGDHVLFGKLEGDDFERVGDELYAIPEKYVLGFVRSAS